MPIDDTVRGSDGWWLRSLARKLNAPAPTRPDIKVSESRRYAYTRQEWYDLLWSYNTGNPPLIGTTAERRDATRTFLRLARANYGMLAVEALSDRVQLDGMRTGADADSAGDDVVRGILAGNGAWLQDALGFTFALGVGYVIVGPGDDPASALITGEDPRQVAVATDPVRPHVARAALKQYRDDDLGTDVKHLYLPAGNGGPDRVMVAVRSDGPASGGAFDPREWEWDADRTGPAPVQGYGVPVVPFTNRLGMGEFEPHIDLLDRIMETVGNRLWIARMQAYRQMAIKGNLPDHDEQGQEIDYDKIFEADPGALWRLPEGVDLWESQVTDITPILASIRDDVREFSAVTRTPLSMFAPEGANQSAAGAESADDGLVFKANDRTNRCSPPAVRVARLALAYAGHEERAKGALQPIWAPTRRLTLEQRAAAAASGKSSGVPQESIYSELWQFDPETTARMMQQRGADLFYSQLAQDVAQPLPTPPADG